ncbi:SCP2 domain-containing protein [Shewanella intestini]|uniref:Ubiquinone biosynthesis accessory factor UbiT n=1 Tax=Shewanella intestini TaxID=2017544 RepID=A0ABS5HXM1_9GAMM|nr:MULTISPECIES: SCP2 sterol-binding domain-containing protein [Shewanella]MBR9726497.1 SCP2 domain-containing protein [Shewanella intestini]MRG34937.1 SCP2 domain-containing protein [Shewanella sp. XMDDZSB0408]
MAQKFSEKLAQNIFSVTPKISRQTLALVPDKLKFELLSQLLNLLLAEQIKMQELAFLENKHVGIIVDDIKLSFDVSIRAGKLQISTMVQPDVVFTANVPELVLVAAGKEDPDTLFFQRKLLIEGDTELGLEVKNLLLGIELDGLPKPVQVAIEKLAITIQTLQKQMG